MAIEVRPPYPVFYGADGVPLENGYVFIGDSGLNPLSNPQTAYADEALTIPLANLRTRGGYIVYNGAPVRLYVQGDYSILVQDSRGRTVYSRMVCTIENPDLFMTTPRGTLARSMRVPPSYAIGSILESGRYAWTNAGTTDYPSACAAADLFGLDVSASPDGSGLVHQRIIDFTLSDDDRIAAWERVSLDAGATWSDWVPEVYNIVESTSTTPYNVVGDARDSTIFVTTGASAFVVNLPAATAARVGNKITIVKADSGAGVIQIAPNGTDVLANAGNVSAYIGTQYRHLTLAVQAAGIWVVVGGEFVPDQAVDTDGSQVALGRLHRLPNTNTSRIITVNPPASGAYTALQAVTGLYGIPSGARAIRARVRPYAYATAGGAWALGVVFSDVNSGLVAGSMGSTSYPVAGNQGVAAAAGLIYGAYGEIDIPLTSGGGFYVFSTSITNITLASSNIDIVPLGFYMGD